MNCQTCNSKRLASVSGKVSDKFYAEMMHVSGAYHGDVPPDMNIGSGDYMGFIYCLECGQIQGVWPLEPTEGEWEAL